MHARSDTEGCRAASGAYFYMTEGRALHLRLGTRAYGTADALRKGERPPPLTPLFIAAHTVPRGAGRYCPVGDIFGKLFVIAHIFSCVRREILLYCRRERRWATPAAWEGTLYVRL